MKANPGSEHTVCEDPPPLVNEYELSTNILSFNTYVIFLLKVLRGLTSSEE